MKGSTMALPSNIGTGLVVGRLVRAVIDNIDLGDEPDVQPIQGATIELSPGIAMAKHLGSDPDPVTIFFETIKASTDEEGYLVNTKTGERGIRLVATNDDDLVPALGYYTVTWYGSGIQKATWRIAVPEGSTIDLTLAAPVPASPAIAIAEWQSIRNEVLAARDVAVDAVGSIGMPSEEVLGAFIGAYLDSNSITTNTSWGNVTGKPSTFPPNAHTHGWSTVTGKPELFPPTEHIHAWDNIASKPIEFNPAEHSHAWDSVTSKPTEFTPAPHNHDSRYYLKTEVDGRIDGHETKWDDITEKPSSFTPSTHQHAWEQVESKPETFPPNPHTHSWDQITSKPSSYVAAPHGHEWEDISGKPTEFTPTQHDHDTRYYTQSQVDDIVQQLVVGDTEFEFSSDWSDITNKPSTFAPSEHEHNDLYYTQDQVDDIVENLQMPEQQPPIISADWADITNKPETFDPAEHDHDDRYFNKSESTAQLLGKLNTSNSVSASTTSELLSIEVVDDNTATDNWLDRFSVKFKRFSDGVSRRVQWWNEYGEWRGAPAKAGTVGWRIFTKEEPSDANHNSLVPVMEMQDNRTSSARLWALMPDGTQQGPGNIPLAYTIVLNAGDSVPAGLPAGTIIYRKS